MSIVSSMKSNDSAQKRKWLTPVLHQWMVVWPSPHLGPQHPALLVPVQAGQVLAYQVHQPFEPDRAGNQLELGDLKIVQEWLTEAKHFWLRSKIFLTAAKCFLTKAKYFWQKQNIYLDKSKIFFFTNENIFCLSKKKLAKELFSDLLLAVKWVMLENHF